MDAPVEISEQIVHPHSPVLLACIDENGGVFVNVWCMSDSALYSTVGADK